MGVFKSIGKVFKGVAKVVKKVVSKVVDVAKKVAGGLSKVFGKLGPIGSIAMAFMLPAVGGWMSAQGGWMAKVADFTSTVFKPITAVKDAIGSGVSTVFKGVSETIGNFFSGFSETGAGKTVTSITDGAKSFFGGTELAADKGFESTVGKLTTGAIEGTEAAELLASQTGLIPGGQQYTQLLEQEWDFLTPAQQEAGTLLPSTVEALQSPAGFEQASMLAEQNVGTGATPPEAAAATYGEDAPFGSKSFLDKIKLPPLGGLPAPTGITPVAQAESYDPLTSAAGGGTGFGSGGTSFVGQKQTGLKSTEELVAAYQSLLSRRAQQYA